MTFEIMDIHINQKELDAAKEFRQMLSPPDNKNGGFGNTLKNEVKKIESHQQVLSEKNTKLSEINRKDFELYPRKIINDLSIFNDYHGENEQNT